MKHHCAACDRVINSDKSDEDVLFGWATWHIRGHQFLLCPECASAVDLLGAISPHLREVLHPSVEADC